MKTEQLVLTALTFTVDTVPHHQLFDHVSRVNLEEILTALHLPLQPAAAPPLLTWRGEGRGWAWLVMLEIPQSILPRGCIGAAQLRLHLPKSGFRVRLARCPCCLTADVPAGVQAVVPGVRAQGHPCSVVKRGGLSSCWREYRTGEKLQHE